MIVDSNFIFVIDFKEKRLQNSAICVGAQLNVLNKCSEFILLSFIFLSFFKKVFVIVLVLCEFYQVSIKCMLVCGPVFLSLGSSFHQYTSITRKIGYIIKLHCFILHFKNILVLYCMFILHGHNKSLNISSSTVCVKYSVLLGNFNVFLIHITLICQRQMYN